MKLKVKEVYEMIPDSEYWSKDDIPDDIRAGLKTVRAHPDVGCWDWDEGTWRWELSLYSDEHADGEGYVYIAPCENEEPFEKCIAPDIWHRGWLIGNIFPKDIYISGTLQEAKDVLDALLFAPTPAIPLISYLAIQTIPPALSAEEFRSLAPGDLIQDGNLRIYLVEHVVPAYPTPDECRLYVRSPGGRDHGKLMMFQLADHEKPIDYESLESLESSRQFSRRVRKPLPVLRELILRLEQGEAPGYDIASLVGISAAQVDDLRNTLSKRPELIPPLLDGTLSLDYGCDGTYPVESPNPTGLEIEMDY